VLACRKRNHCASYDLLYLPRLVQNFGDVNLTLLKRCVERPAALSL
jgi:hypothetical protein